MYVPPLSVGQASDVSIAVTHIEKNIPYVVVSAEKPREPKRKSEKLVEVETHKSKRVKKQAARIEKRKETLLTIVDSNEEEEEEEEV